MKNIQELSKKTLGKYINRASNDMKYSADSAADAREYKDDASENDSWNRIKKRQKGISRAANKLTKEETIAELSKKTLGKYINRATDNASGHGYDIGKASGAADAEYNAKGAKSDDEFQKRMHGRVNKGKQKLSNRITGIKTATNKLTKEEVETMNIITEEEFDEILEALSEEDFDALNEELALIEANEDGLDEEDLAELSMAAIKSYAAVIAGTKGEKVDLVPALRTKKKKDISVDSAISMKLSKEETEKNLDDLMSNIMSETPLDAAENFNTLMSDKVEGILDQAAEEITDDYFATEEVDEDGGSDELELSEEDFEAIEEMMNEEIEAMLVEDEELELSEDDLLELSKKTLGRYVKSADKDKRASTARMSNAYATAANLRNKEGLKGAARDEEDKGDAAADRAIKRTKGMAAVNKKLSK